MCQQHAHSVLPFPSTPQHWSDCTGEQSENSQENSQKNMLIHPRVAQELEEVEAKLEADEKGQSRWRRELGRFCTPVFLEAFVLNFLAEWGDRSQIATISLAAQYDP